MRVQFKLNWCGLFTDAVTRIKLKEQADTSVGGASHSDNVEEDKDACQWKCLTDRRCTAAMYRSQGKKCFIYYGEVTVQQQIGSITLKKDNITSPGEFTWRHLLFSL